MQKESNYFPNLNSLRFIAASLVVLSHSTQYKGYHNYKNYYNDYPMLFKGSHLAVIFFFVLSGFLITHIIFQQIQKSNFSVIDFYKKRILRIWPLYYLVVITGIYVIPNIPVMVHHTKFVGSISDLSPSDLNRFKLLYFLVLPNLGLFYGVIQYLGHLWSIGTEEQFYLIWPLLLKWFPNRLLELLLGVILIVWTFRFCANMFDLKPFAGFLSMFRIDSMAIGGLGAAILIKYPQFKTMFLNRKVELSALFVVSILYFFHIGLQMSLGGFPDEIFSIFFAIIIFNAAANPNTILKLERFKLLNYLGTISYGIYMYHAITGALALIIFQWIHPSYMATLSSNLAYYLIVFSLTIGVATISYELVEKKIITWGRTYWLTRHKP